METNTTHGIFCILPPHILREIIKRGTDEHRHWALKTLVSTEQFRGRRQVVGLIPSIMNVAGQKMRTVYDAQNGTTLPGKLVRGEGDPSTNDPAVDEAYDGAGSTYDFYYKIYQRNSIDGQGMRLDSSVHYDQNFNNAFWNGSQMIYGDGDGNIFTRFTKSVDVIGHELTHGVTQHTASLLYEGQSGALNEHFSDVFGSLVKQYALNQTADKADWLIGAGLFTPNIHGTAIRSMKAPGTAYDDPLLGKDPQPDNMANYQNIDYDNGGVHINSGIPNKAFYLVATTIGGYAWEKTGLIWYKTLTERLNQDADFQTTANMTYQVAGDLFGQSSNEQKAVNQGWSAVGIKII